MLSIFAGPRLIGRLLASGVIAALAWVGFKWARKRLKRTEVRSSLRGAKAFLYVALYLTFLGPAYVLTYYWVAAVFGAPEAKVPDPWDGMFLLLPFCLLLPLCSDAGARGEPVAGAAGGVGAGVGFGADPRAAAVDGTLPRTAAGLVALAGWFLRGLDGELVVGSFGGIGGSASAGARAGREIHHESAGRREAESPGKGGKRGSGLGGR